MTVHPAARGSATPGSHATRTVSPAVKGIGNPRKPYNKHGTTSRRRDQQPQEATGQARSYQPLWGPATPGSQTTSTAPPAVKGIGDPRKPRDKHGITSREGDRQPQEATRQWMALSAIARRRYNLPYQRRRTTCDIKDIKDREAASVREPRHHPRHVAVLSRPPPPMLSPSVYEEKPNSQIKAAEPPAKSKHEKRPQLKHLQGQAAVRQPSAPKRQGQVAMRKPSPNRQGQAAVRQPSPPTTTRTGHSAPAVTSSSMIGRSASATTTTTTTDCNTPAATSPQIRTALRQPLATIRHKPPCTSYHHHYSAST